MKHKHYDLAYRAYYNMSFSPDKRAKTICAEFDADIKRLNDSGVEAKKIEKYEKLFVVWLCSLSRCASPAVTGPARFPIGRNRKALESEQKRLGALLDYYRYITSPKSEFIDNGIRSGKVDTKEKLQAEIERLVAKQEAMKAHNAEVRKTKQGEVHRTFELTNNLANIKRLQERLRNEAFIENTAIDTISARFTVKTNDAIGRIQIVFDHKPCEKVREVLKKQAFKWAPSQNAWQRQTTLNAIAVTRNIVIPFLIAELAQ
jgi:hypothetical protein